MSTAVDETPEEAWEPKAPRKRFEDSTEMDITPMIDCTFLLLIFFVVCSQTDVQSAIQMAKARHGVTVGAKTATIITIAESGRESADVYLADGKEPDAILPEDAEQQAELIRQAVQTAMDEGKVDVLVKAEKGVPHRDVARISAAASQVEGIHLFFGVTDAEK